MIPFNQGKLDEWLGSYESFNSDFRLFCFANFHAFGLDAGFVPNALKQCHEQWTVDCGNWLKNESAESTQHLSQLKIISLLLYNLVSEPFLGQFYEHDYAHPSYTYQGSDSDKVAAKRDLQDVRETLLAMDFCLIAAAWFEENRSDKTTPYRQPLTSALRHDLIGYLLSSNRDRHAIYLILKALFSRP